MTRARSFLLSLPLFALQLFSAGLHAQSPKEEPLPPGAIHRLGTAQFRHPVAGQAAYSPDGKILATGGMDIRLWDAKTRRLLRVLPLPERPVDGDVVHLRFTADGKTLYCQGSGPGQVSAFDVASGKKLFRFIPEMHIGAFDISPDGQTLATGGQQGQLILWNAATRERIRALDALDADKERYYHSIAFSPDGKHLAAMATHTPVRIYDAVSGALKHTLPVTGTYYNRLVFSPEGYLASYSGASPTVKESAGKITLWNVTTGKIHKEYPWGAVWGPDYHGLAFSPDGEWMAGDNGKGQLAVWDRAIGKHRFTDPRSMIRFQGLAFSKDGDTLISGCVDLWDLNTGRSLMADEGHVAFIQALDLTPDGRTAITTDGITVRIWDTQTGKERRRFEAIGVSALALSFDGKFLAGNLYGSNSVVLWDMQTGKELRRIPMKDDPARVAFSPDGQTIAASAAHNLTVLFFNVETGKEIRHIVGNRAGEMGLNPLPFRFSPDGKYFASLINVDVRGLQLGLWDLSKKDANVLSMTFDTGYIFTPAFSPDVEYLAWADPLGTHVWDLRTRKRLPIKAAPGQVAFTPDGRYLIAGAKLIPLDPRHEARELPVLPGFLACSRDSNTLVVVPQNDCTALVFDARKIGK